MNDIDKALQEIFFQRIGVRICDEAKNKMLLGGEIQCPIRELILVLYDVENVFKISIGENELLQGDFDTYNHIYSLVQKKLMV